MKLCRRFLRLPAWERAACCRLAGLQLYAWLVLQLFGLEAAARHFQVCAQALDFRALPPGVTPTHFVARCHVLAGALRWLGLFRQGCLARSLALGRFLASHGIPAIVRIGVEPDSGQLLAHAWVECEALPAGGEDVSPFRGIAAFACLREGTA
jgi:hypothetical protein